MPRRDSRMCSLPLETDDRRVQRLGRTHRIEVLAKKSDLPGPGTKEHDILLAVNTSGRLDKTFRLHFGDGGCWVGEGMHSHIRKAELLHCPQEPRYVPYDRFAAGQALWMANGRRIGQLPDDLIGNEGLPWRIVSNERLKMLQQQIRRSTHVRRRSPLWRESRYRALLP